MELHPELAYGSPADTECGSPRNPLRAALVGMTPSVYAFWLGAISCQRKHSLTLRALWMKSEVDARSLNKRLFRDELQCYYDNPAAPPKSQPSSNLDALINSSECDLILLGLAPGPHADVVLRILKNSKKHIFSLNPPTRDVKTLSTLLVEYNKKNVALAAEDSQAPDQLRPAQRWVIAETMRHESAFNKFAMIFRDIGNPIGGQLISTLPSLRAVLDCETDCNPFASHIPHSLRSPSLSAVSLSQSKSGKSNPIQHDRTLFDTCVSTVSLLRRILGAVVSVNCVTSAPGSFPGVQSVIGQRIEEQKTEPALLESIGGVTKFANDIIITTNITLSSKVPRWSLKIWGTIGHVTINWDNDKRLYETQRYLNHFEYPSYHKSSGYTWCLEAFVEAIHRGDPEPNLPENFMLDLSIVDAMFESHGANVTFRMPSD